MNFKTAMNRYLADAKSARAAINSLPTKLIQPTTNQWASASLRNLANCILNRQLDIFDDSVFLMENNRLPSAFAISRGMIETHAFGRHLCHKLESLLSSKTGSDSVEAAEQLIQKYINSSRYKEELQKHYTNGTFEIDNLYLTEQARDRILYALAGSEHLMNALRALYKEELSQTGKKESQFQDTYDGLSEWVHPSQTSVFHHYVRETHMVPTSQGPTNIHDGGRMMCIKALSFISETQPLYDRMLDIAQELEARYRRYDKVSELEIRKPALH